MSTHVMARTHPNADADADADASAALPVRERRRALEILKYGASLRSLLQPAPDEELEIDFQEASPRSTADPMLTALAQLAGLRLNAQRALICLVDGVEMHSLAEATRTVSPYDIKSHAPGDRLVFGVKSMPYNLCLTSHSMPAYLGHPNSCSRTNVSVFDASKCVITDLQIEPRVAGSGFMRGNTTSRFYAEVPLRSIKGVVVGIVCVLDDSPRSDPASIDVRPLHDVAQLAVQHLELTRLKDISERASRLMEGLGRFNTGQSSFQPQDTSHTDDFRSNNKSRSTERVRSNSPSPRSSSVALSISPQVQPDSQTSPPRQVAGAGADPNAMPLDELYSNTDQSGIEHVFSRASNLLRQSMDLDAVCFVEFSMSTLFNHNKHDETLPLALSHEFESGAGTEQRSEWPPPQKSAGTICRRLAYSTRLKSSVDQDSLAQSSLTVSEATLRDLTALYPSGHIFNFEAQSPFSSGDDSLTNQHRVSHRKQLARAVGAAFPGVRSLIFLPMYDNERRNLYAACFGWVEDPLRILQQDECVYVSGFTNSIMCEVMRLEALMLDKAKSDFMSSISHELRSPLHGILAANQLMQESRLSMDQNELVLMINSCGRTLLDIMNDLLDYAKINNLANPSIRFSKSLKSRASSNSSIGSGHMRQELDGGNKSFIDLAGIFEDTICSVAAGYAVNTTMTSLSTTSDRSHDQASSTGTVEKQQNILLAQGSSRIIVIIDIQHRDDWSSSIEAGVWRRIVMNIVGNALKYTESGYILAKLRVEDKPRANGRPSEFHVVLSVTDTGRGISERYLKHRLYVPFAQEDNLSAGVGLGLSIVNRLIVDLGGHIHIDSQVGVGTNVVMTIPLQSKIQRPGTPLQDRNIRPASHAQLRQSKEVLCFEGFDSGQGSTLHSARTEYLNDLALLKLKQVLTQLAETWLSTKVTTIQDEATIFVIEESYALSIFQSNPESALFKKKYILISRSELLNTNSTQWKGCYNRIVTPIGPIKLARVLATIIQQGIHDGEGTSPESQAIRTGSDLPGTPMLQVQPHPRGEGKSPTSPLTTKTDSPEVCRILLVDDNDINVRILANLVRKLRFPFATASNGQEALDQYIAGHEEGRPFQVIFMDISMPVMDGLTATRRIRTYERESSMTKPVDVFALTGLGQENTREEATASGVDQYFLKPVKLDLLRELLKDRGISA